MVSVKVSGLPREIYIVNAVVRGFFLFASCRVGFLRQYGKLFSTFTL